MLVIPSIEISQAVCTRVVRSDSPEASTLYGYGPVETARLWRRENAKSIHLTDLDGLQAGELSNHEMITELARELEIPIQLVSRFESVEECRQWLAAGIYRIVIHDLVQADPLGVATLVTEYGSSRIIAGAITRGSVIMPLSSRAAAIDTLEYAQRARDAGIARILHDDRDYEGMLRGPNFAELERLATGSGMRVTAAGGVASVEQLWMLQQMESLGIDSVVIGRAFYENLFPCQQLWRDIELERMANGIPGEDVSTSTLLPRDDDTPSAE
jgi:phosphoribosylformimino-5-aminoimidazole carboxamide ribotide isomerase